MLLPSGHDLNPIAIMQARADWQLLLGGAVGPVAAMFYAVGMSIFFLTLKSVNYRLAAFASLALAAMVLVGGAYHAVFTMYGFVGRVGNQIERELLTGNVRTLYNWLAWMSYACGTLGTLTVLTLGIRRESEFPKWLLPLLPANLVVLCFLLTPAFESLPAPLGGLIRGGRINGSFVLFFALATWAFWSSGESRASAVVPIASGAAAKPVIGADDVSRGFHPRDLRGCCVVRAAAQFRRFVKTLHLPVM
ncbi:MAG: hypothetical protein WKF74_17315 [Pyrinomonadaceae bacterium]